MPPTYPPTSTPLSPTTPVTASLITSPTIPTPTYSSPATFTIHTKTIIYTSTDPFEGLKLVRDTKTWPSWNSFCPQCEFSAASKTLGADLDGNQEGEEEGLLRVGSKVTFDVFMDGMGLVGGAQRTLQSMEEVTVLEEFSTPANGEGGGGRKGWRVGWKQVQFPEWLLRAERVLEFVELGGGEVGWEFTSWETFGGAMAMVVKFMHGAILVERFGDYSRDLKAHFDKKQIENNQ